MHSTQGMVVTITFFEVMISPLPKGTLASVASVLPSSPQSLYAILLLDL
jgi:hypothetical protein